MAATHQSWAADDVSHYPPLSAQADSAPRSMLVLSNDHNWYSKAYTDWSDLDGDGVIDSTYRSDFEYHGYFDSRGCYAYDSGLNDGAFRRVGDTGNGNAEDGEFSCNGNNSWSGNLLNWATMTRIDIIRKALYGGKRYRDDTTQTTLLERAFLPMDSHSFSKIISDRNIINKNTPFNGVSAVTFCNTTYHAKENIYSGAVTDPPLIRVATGDENGSKVGWPKWASTEQWQCPWRGERQDWSDFPLKTATNSKEYRARVEVCTSAGENGDCTSYPDSAYPKPTGLLHDYAKDIEFGMFTGSYKNNKQGGVLRANFESFGSEFSASSGVFDTNYSGIVSNLDAFKIAKYSYQDGNYNSSSGDDCPWGRGSFSNGSCSNWGNPLGESTLEALRYISGESSPTDIFSVGTGDVETSYISGLTSPAWNNDLSDKWCAAHSLLLVNASEISFDSDDLGAPGSSPISAAQIRTQTNAVGTAEGISGEYFVGQTSASGGTSSDKFCTAKTLSGLSDAKGVCPTAPGLEGSYSVAGLARFAHNDAVIQGPKGDAGQPIDTYAVQLASNVPLVSIPIGGGESVSLIPACSNTTAGGKCAIVNFLVESQASDGSSGSFLIDWEDSEFGGDYDFDAEVRLSYALSGERLSITTSVTRAAASHKLGLGYILSGTSGRYGAEEANNNKIVVPQSDGFNVHTGINGYINDYPGSLCPAGAPCDGSPATTATYRVSGNTGQELQTPLYYAAKYGNDSRREDGSPGAYFEVNRIDELAETLRNLLDQVLENTNRTGAGVTIGYDGDVKDYIFQTLYNNQYSWSGDVQAVKLKDDGTVSSVWSARDKLPSASSRQIVTRNPYTGTGIPFTASAFESAGLQMTSTLRNLIGYLRGQAENEQRYGGDYRDRLWLNGRESAKLGDFIGSQPYLVGVPNTYFVPDEGDTSYATFRTTHRDRTPVLYVGGNDGMLHGFDAATGVERLGYVPGLLLEQLPELADPDYNHRYFVDGSPTVLDARYGERGAGAWVSLLASGLGSGGKGLFALDVTDPNRFSESNASSLSLWEYGPDDDAAVFGEDGRQLGYVYNQPSVVRMENGRFAVVFGNGYANDAGKASLYILFIDGGKGGSWSSSDVVRLTPAATDNNGDNGMTTVSLLDRDEDGRVDLAYGADLQGNIWRFDLSSTDPAGWDDGIHQLFSGIRDGEHQVITSTLEIGEHPDGGLMVFFGTGTQDNYGLPTTQDRKTADSFYAIRDFAGRTARDDTLTRDDLSGRALHQATLDDQDGTSAVVRYLDPIDTSRYPANGWYLDFFGTERVVDGPSLRGNRILFASLIPGYGICGAEDGGYLYELNAWYGSAFSRPVLDVNGDGEVDEQDGYYPSSGGDGIYVPIGVATNGAIFTPRVMLDDEGKQEIKVSAGTNGSLTQIAEKPLNSMKLGRVTWRVLE
ncbi:hypothetical protein BTW08_04625 [Salinicola sp. MH3R3-1]|uniref:pilus assembly protein n=1 Tax=Salinicola sp. MH3R3-1 TaxID=1928762 RepID=UPI00094F37DF|nr:PilC/PilY family type IV pilus protein [Salinicola sp. MH3R3-1]OLO08926.1 hypothetical protein BTW08_04625 [Salinicola sp. MH3R3-1]